MNRDEKRLKKYLSQRGYEEDKLRKRAAQLRKQARSGPKNRAPKLDARNWEEWVEEHQESFEKLGRGSQDSLDRWVSRLRENEEDGSDSETVAAGEAGALVLWVGAGRCQVLLDDELVECVIPPALARTQRTDLAVGDRVALEERAGAEPAIAGIAPRRTWLSRRDPHNAHLERVLIANVDVVVIVVACGSPPLRPGLIDRFLIAIARGGAEPLVCANKTDLLADEGERLGLDDVLAPYHELGVPVYRCSAESGAGVPELRAALRGRMSALVGHSGVGKSSLLNALQPDLSLRTTSVRAGDGGGRHTTTASTLYELEDGARIIDTPGIRELALGPLSREELREAFSELEPWASQCRFNDCAHAVEPDCAVRAAVERGELSHARFASYQRLLSGEG